MRKFFRSVLVLVASAGVLGGCANLSEQLAQSGQFDPRLAKATDAVSKLAKGDATPQEEAAIGRVSASMLLGSAPLVKSPEPLRYINNLGSWIARHTGREDIKWRFGIIDSPNINAFAAPDGYVFVTRGLFVRLRNESELAGVIAHEMAHVIRRHYLVAARKKDTAGAIGALSGMALEVAGVPSEGSTPLFNLARNIYGSGLDKNDEYDADRLGIIYATRAGYDPFGLPRVISMYAANAGSEGFDLLFSTHPSPADRLKNIDKTLGDKLAPFESTGVTDSPTFARMVALLQRPGSGSASNTAPTPKAPKAKPASGGSKAGS